MNTKYVLPAVAVAVAAACGSAHAATLTTGTVAKRVGTERLTAEVAVTPSFTVSLPALNFQLGSDAYRTGDTVTITLSGANIASVDPTATNNNFICSSAAGDTGTGVGSAGAVKLSYQSNTSSVITYRVERPVDAATAPVYLSSSTALVCSLATDKIYVTGSSLQQANVVNVNYGATGAGISYDSLINNQGVNETSNGGAGAVPVIYSMNQFVVPSLSSKDFLGRPEPVTQGTLTKSTLSGSGFGTGTAGSYASVTFTLADEGQKSSGTYAAKMSAAGSLIIASSATQIVTLTGDFNFLDDDQNGCTAADLTNGAGTFTALGGTATINSTCTAITITSVGTPLAGGGAAGGDGYTREKSVKFGFKLNGADNDTSAATPGSISKSGRPLVAQTFGGSVVWQATDATGTVTKYREVTLSPGSWSSAVATTGAINIPYLPYGTGISRIVYFTNKGTTAGTAVIDARGENGTICSSTNFAAVSIPAGGIALLNGAIDDGISACLGSTYAGKAQVNVTITGTASGDITSNYKVGENRVNIVNSSNK